MRTISAAQQAVLNSGNQSEHIRVSIKDSGGTFRDLTTYPGFNAVKAVSWNDKVDSPHMVAEVTLFREQHKLSLAPFMTNSALNRGFNPSASYAALIALNREVKIEVAIVGMDKSPSSGDWFEVFRGRVDDFDEASGPDVRFSCRDLGGRLAQQFIKTELVYAYAQDGGNYVPLRIWEPQMAVVLNQTYCLPASRGPTDPGFNRFFKCSQSGTTGTSEPTWSTGTNISDGTAKWNYVGAPTASGVPVQNVMQNILNDHKSSGDPTVTLYTPSSPGWAVRQFIQKREYVLNAITALAKQIGWEVKYKWRSGTSQFELTFSQPNRSSPSVAYTFAANEYEDPTRLGVNIAEIRNSWRIVYSDASDTFPDGTPKRKTIEVSDATSISQYGELWAEIQEDQASNVDSSTEATTLVNAALSDCKDPTAELALPLVRGFPWVETNDYYTFTANGLHFDNNQSLAVVGFNHVFEGGKLKTSLELRGRPTLGALAWLPVTVHPSHITPYVPEQVQYFNERYTASVETLPAPGGAQVLLVEGGDKRRGLREFEVHISETPGFSLTGGSLKGVIVDKMTSLHGLRPGTTYYGRTVPRSIMNGRVARGQPSAEFSFVAGRVDAGMLDRLARGLIPNANFQDIYDTDPEDSTTPPDHWEIVSGTWGLGNDARAQQTAEYGWIIRLEQTGPGTGGMPAVMRGPVFPIPIGTPNLVLTANLSPFGSLSPGYEVQFHVDFYTDPEGAYSNGSADVAAPYDLTAADTWSQFVANITAPAGAAYAQVSFYKNADTEDYGWAVAGVDMFPATHMVTMLNGVPHLGVGFASSGARLHIQGVDNGGIAHALTLGSSDSGGTIDIRAENNTQGLRIYPSNNTLTGSPDAPALQFFGNGSGFPGQVYFDSGAHNSAAIVFRTAQGGGSITERMRIAADGTITMTQQAWQLITPNTGAGWSHYSAGEQAECYKTPHSWIESRGSMKKSTAAASGNVIGTFPAGYRPAKDVSFVVAASGGWCRLSVATNGNITIWDFNGTPASFLYLNNIRFDTRS